MTIFIYVSIITLYFFITAMAGKFAKRPRYSPNPLKKRIAILITAYREDHVIIDTAAIAKAHDYPSDRFEVFVAADQLQPTTINRLREIPVKVVEMNFKIGSKARSLHHLLNSIPTDEFDIAIILDSDNQMLPGCLEQVNDAFQKGFKAVQTHRTAKNKDSSIAILDAISEEINNNLFRRGQRALGFSSNTIGSGMAFEFEKLRQVYNKPGILSNPACDREVDFEMMKSNICIEFIDDAIVLDEKVAAKNVFIRQRTRWLESQLFHLGLFFSRKERVPDKDKNYWNKLFTNLVPPRLFFLVLFVLVLGIYLGQQFIDQQLLLPGIGWWIVVALLFITTLLISIPTSYYSLKSLKAVSQLPLVTVSMLRALIRMRPGRKEFIHTPKSFTGDREKTAG